MGKFRGKLKSVDFGFKNDKNTTFWEDTVFWAFFANRKHYVSLINSCN